MMLCILVQIILGFQPFLVAYVMVVVMVRSYSGGKLGIGGVRQLMVRMLVCLEKCSMTTVKWQELVIQELRVYLSAA